MSNIVLDNSKISKHLGQVSEYKDQYDADLLVAEPRSNNRKHLNISDDDLPFVGYDIWNAYEVSGLTENGLPVSGVAKIVYSCDSKYIVESKSIKLYFNSFNMFKCGVDESGVLNFIADRSAKDLSNLLGTDVSVHLQPSYIRPTGEDVFNTHKYNTLESFVTNENLYGTSFVSYQEDPSLLNVVDHWPSTRVGKPIHHHSSLLKSNCRVTSQPDWGDIYVSYIAEKMISPISLLKYIISFRDECHFHEEICETVYKRISDTLNPESLVVSCLYARRGGIDINPTRASDKSFLNKKLIDCHTMHVKTAKQ
jgi:7-cyano-7-deazaguanine reductase